MKNIVIESGYWCKQCKHFFNEEVFLDSEFGCGECKGMDNFRFAEQSINVYGDEE
ncbi:hypothetical protein [Tenuibacillus multivorans]|uniref:hypothetical protein n=1 Tax=Tenuibacillus multivorans TaxID=237069 RepID=UPI00116AD73D|nr:hypothetical protein [Tenuibacillus multivorans]GEL75775.1 hypothetical protein TMU01_00100 [Tenuibacillus multivorans]